jgi:uncharacterized protein
MSVLRRILATSLGLVAVGGVLSVNGCRSMIFHPAPNEPGMRQQYESHRFEIASDGEKIEGWWLENPAASNDVVVLYFAGNAEDVLYTAGSIAKLNARTVVFMNYRGYGNSTGKPGEEALYADGLALYDYAIGRGVKPAQLVVMGRSLGSGVASMLAGSRPVRGAILITPYDSISSVAEASYPKFAVRLLVGSADLPSVEWARKAQGPALLLAGERDNLIPPVHARRLADAWVGKSELHVLKAVGHNDISRSPEYYSLINAFLTR